uniref:Uncharacterized protein n=1 Tax=Solibacter usitatus (strain Ellin6076) TaxID=234267 RepID=Q01QW5_SOLUE
MRTPAGTCSGRCKESADGSMATKARRSQRAGQQSKENMRKGKAMVGGSSAHEAPPQTPPGGEPPETPAPFPSGTRFQNGGNPSRVRKPAQHRRALDRFPPF